MKTAGFYRRKCTEDEAALRSEIRTNLRVTRVVVIKCFCSLSDPHGHDGPFTRRLLSQGPIRQLLFLVPTVIPMTPSSTNLSFWLPTQFLATIQFMSVRHLIKDGSSCLSVLTVTPIDRLHDGDGSNGVKGAAEEGKLCKM